MTKVKIHSVPGDGSCFYHAVRIHLICRYSGTNYTVPSVKRLRKLTAYNLMKVMKSRTKSFAEMQSYAMFYVQDANMTLNSYMSGMKKTMWAGPLEAMLLANALKMRIQIFSTSALRKSKKAGIFKIKEEPLVDTGDKRRTPIRIVIKGYNQVKGHTGCHYDALI